MLYDVIVSLILAAVAVAIISAAVHLIVKTDIGKMAAIVLIGIFVMGAAAGCYAEEIRRVEVVDFDFRTAEVILQDEDGYIWACPFGENSWALGEEYELYLPDEGESEIRTVCEDD